MDPISTARYGLIAATQQLEASAQRVAAGGDNLDQVNEIVDQIQAKQAFAADVGIIKIADKMWQSLLDLQSR